jgi:hypothetical protein
MEGTSRNMQINISDKEFHTILAALRFWQRNAKSNESEQIIASNLGSVRPIPKRDLEYFIQDLNFGTKGQSRKSTKRSKQQRINQ